MKIFAIRSTSELAEIIEDGVTGRLVTADDKVQLAAVTNKLLDNPELVRRMGDAARMRTESNYGIAVMAERFTALYDKLVTDSPR